jgi:hypothetical protein
MIMAAIDHAGLVKDPRRIRSGESSDRSEMASIIDPKAILGSSLRPPPRILQFCPYSHQTDPIPQRSAPCDPDQSLDS